jgi:hypothetical protein
VGEKFAAKSKGKIPKFPARNSPGSDWRMADESFCSGYFMWSNDFPHAASTWPHSRQVIAEELGHLPKDVLRKVIRENVIKLYNLKIDGVNN